MAAFRSALEDAILVCRKLAPLCSSVEQLAEMLELAVLNDAQARLLMDMVTKTEKKYPTAR